MTSIRKALDLAEDALQSFQRLHCLRGEVGVGPLIVFMGGKRCWKMQENHVSSHAGKHVKRFGNDFPPSRELYEKYPPTYQPVVLSR